MRFRPPIRFWIFCAACLALHPSCGNRSTDGGTWTRARVVSAEATQTRVDVQVADDPGIAALVKPYRDSFESRMAEVVAIAPRLLTTGRPEGLLGNLVADIMLERARAATDLPVKVAIANNGGLRVALEPGEVTLGEIYELMPFDNEIIVLRLTSAEMDSLANQIAAIGGEPVAGMSFAIQAGRAIDIRVAGRPLGTDDIWVATSDYLTGGGGQMPALWSPQERVTTGVLVRDAIADGLRAPGTMKIPQTGRITER